MTKLFNRSLNRGQPVNWSCPLARGLVSWWMVHPGTMRGSILFRDLCNKNHGTLTNMDPATDWQGPQGRLGGFGCLDFDGSDDYVELKANMVTSNVLTIATWVYPQFTVGSAYRGIFAWTPNSNSDQMEIGSLSDSDAGGVVWGGNYNNKALSARKLVQNTWEHIVLTSDGTNTRLHMNGQSGGTAGTTNFTSTQWAETPELSPARNARWLGKIGDTLIWNRALSASEVLALYNDSRRGHPEMLNWIRPTWYVEQAGGGGGGLYKFGANLRANMDDLVGGMAG